MKSIRTQRISVLLALVSLFLVMHILMPAPVIQGGTCTQYIEITGTTGANTLTIDGPNGEWTLDSDPAVTFDETIPTFFFIDMLGGDDTVTITESTTATDAHNRYYVKLGGGDDTLSLYDGPSSGVLQAVCAGGADEITVTDDDGLDVVQILGGAGDDCFEYIGSTSGTADSNADIVNAFMGADSDYVKITDGEGSDYYAIKGDGASDDGDDQVVIIDGLDQDKYDVNLNDGEDCVDIDDSATLDCYLLKAGNPTTGTGDRLDLEGTLADFLNDNLADVGGSFETVTVQQDPCSACP